MENPVHMIEWLADRYGFDLLGCSTVIDQRNAIRYMKRVHRDAHPSEFDETAQTITAPL